ncbi:MAG: hypothetical protein JO019_03270 [Candidatus Kaiserbacteria bacterium]|nr:hypothetical protein [Candidatus Kaiserbacteria bacterium]
MRIIALAIATLISLGSSALAQSGTQQFTLPQTPDLAGIAIVPATPSDMHLFGSDDFKDETAFDDYADDYCTSGKSTYKLIGAQTLVIGNVWRDKHTTYASVAPSMEDYAGCIIVPHRIKPGMTVRVNTFGNRLVFR